MSNDISDIYTEIYAAGLVVDLGESNYLDSALSKSPLFPPGLVVNREAAQASTEFGKNETFRDDEKQMKGNIIDQVSREKTTWAKVASLPGVLDWSKLSGIDLTTSPSQRTVNMIPPEAAKPDYNEPLSRQQRVAFVRGFPKGTRLSTVTAVLQTFSGPIMSILLDKDPVHPFLSACIIFQFAEDNIRFVAENRNYMAKTGQTYYGRGISVSMGGTWPEDEEIRSMSTTGKRERRRLTFSASGLFTRVTRNRFEAEIIAIAGEANIELIWLFNAGNATVVLASVGSQVNLIERRVFFTDAQQVRVARVVRSRFLAKSLEDSVWKGLAVNFSSDPCEKELRLVTQMKSGPEPETVQRMSHPRMSRIPSEV